MEIANGGLLTFLLNALWQIPVIVAIAWSASRLMRNGPASHVHAIWVAALMLAVSSPLISIRSSVQNTGVHISVDDWVQSATPAPAAISADGKYPRANGVTPSKPLTVRLATLIAIVLPFAYFLFLFFRLVGLALATVRTIRIRSSAVERALLDSTRKVWDRCCEAMKLSRVRLKSAAGISGPLTVGNSVILPELMMMEMAEDIVTAAIGHEMAHVTRQDFAFNLIYELMYLPISFHPAAWIIRRAIVGSKELACDELVTQTLLTPEVYARSIVTIAAQICGNNSPGYTLGVSSGDILEERVRRLMERPISNRKRARLILAGGLSALGSCAIGISGLAVSARAQGAAAGEMKIAVDAYNRGDLDNTIRHFENAVLLEPANNRIKLFLASAYVRAFLDKNAEPGSPLVANARKYYQDVIRVAPRDTQALNGMVAVCLNTRQFAEAREWAMKLVQADSRDKQGYLYLGTLDFLETFPPIQSARRSAHIQPAFASHGMLKNGAVDSVQLPDPLVRKQLQDQVLPKIADGLRMLQTALQVDPNYWGAMAYIGQLLRLQASLADDAVVSRDLVRQSNDWMQRAESAAEAHRFAQQPGPMDLDGAPPNPPVSIRM